MKIYKFQFPVTKFTSSHRLSIVFAWIRHTEGASGIASFSSSIYKDLMQRLNGVYHCVKPSRGENRDGPRLFDALIEYDNIDDDGGWYIACVF